MRSATWQQVYARRLRQSWLDERAPHDALVPVVEQVLGVHAQLMTAAELALSARVDGVTRDEVAKALWQQRTLVKGNAIRGTLHLTTPRDYALWKAAYDPRWRDSKWLEWQELSLAEAEQVREAVLDVLDEPRTREEIGAAVGGRLGRRIAEDSWGHLLAPSASECCHGPPRGRLVTFVRCDRWLDTWRKPAQEAALRELVGRYVETYGPVRRDELEHWFARRLPDDVLDDFEEIDVEGHRTFAPSALELGDERPCGVRLLAHYDVYVIACHPRSHLIPERRERIFLRGAGPHPAVLVDGRVRGTWTRTRRGKRLEIDVELFAPLTRPQRAELADEADRVAALFGSQAVLTVDGKRGRDGLRPTVSDP